MEINITKGDVEDILEEIEEIPGKIGHERFYGNDATNESWRESWLRIIAVRAISFMRQTT